jgi:predicted nucleotidyltransferase
MKDKSLILNLIKSTVTQTDPSAILILYGFYARNDYDKNSDIDLLILLEKEKITRADEKRIKYPLYEIEFESGTVISPLILSKSSWESKHRITPFYENVTKEGIIL